MTDKAKHWSKGLLAGIITGASGAFLSALGISGAEAVGITVTQLDLKQLTAITVAGGFVGAAAYLKQSPIIPDE